MIVEIDGGSFAGLTVRIKVVWLLTALVSVTINGRLEMTKIKIEPQVLEGGDVEMLQDLVMAAVNQGIRSAQQLMAQEMSQLTGGLKIPGLT